MFDMKNTFIYTVLSVSSYMLLRLAPDRQLFNLASICRLITVLMRPVTVVSPANIRILTEGTFEVQPVMYSEKSKWEENTSLRGASADHESPRCEFPQPHLLLPVCHEAEPIE